MVYGIGNNLGRKRLLYFFYDCEATDLDVEVDRIVEVAAVIHLASLRPRVQRELRHNDKFSSLCYSDRELGEVPQRLTGLTRDDLRDEPPLEEVLKRFFEWMEVSIATANRLDHEEYTPVLVAHGGNILDFPMLVNEINRIPLVKKKFHSLGLRYMDTFSVLAELKRSRKLNVDKLAMKAVYEALFFTPYQGHRALADAQALCKIFTEAQPANDISIFRKYIQSQEEMLVMKEQGRKFKEASIGFAKASELLAKEITYEKMARQYQTSPHHTFKSFLRMECQIRHPKQQQEIMSHLRLY